MDCIVHGVTKSRTRLSDLCSLHFLNYANSKANKNLKAIKGVVKSHYSYY